MPFLGNLNVRLNGQTAGFTADMLAAERSMTRFSNHALKVGQQWQHSGRAMRSLGTKMTMGLTLPLVGMAAAATKSFASFDMAMTRSLAIMGDVSAEMRGRMADAASAMSIRWNVSADKVAESFYFLASAGLDAEQSLAALPTMMAFAKAGAFDLAEATSLLTDAQSALGMKVKDPMKHLANMTKIADRLVVANTLADASTKQFAEALASEAAAAGKNFGVSMDQVIAVLAAYAE